MNYLKFKNFPPAPMLKEFFNVGEGPAHDMDVSNGTSAVNHPILFSIREEGGQHWLLPGDEKIRLDGVTVHDAIVIPDCARIQWPRGEALFIYMPTVELPVEKTVTEISRGMLDALSKTCIDADSQKGIEGAIAETLQSLCDAAGADEATLLCENTDRSEWNVVATYGENTNSKTRLELLSDLIGHALLEEVLRTGLPVFLENLAGHPLEAQARQLQPLARSCACLPLTVASGRVIGALFLFTISEEKTLDKWGMPAAQLVATQASLFLNAVSRNHEEEAPLRLGALNKIAQQIKKLAPKETNVLIGGEFGTGKYVVAREIHRLSKRSNNRFVALNCAAIPPSLIEKILFGQNGEGKILQADGGTLYLDEVGLLSADLQAKIFRVFQECEVQPSGADAPIPVSIRFVASSHQDLEARANQEAFRKDLYQGLNGGNLVLPPLKDRGVEEIRLLALSFLARISPHLKFSEDAMTAIEKYSWPGNVRELEQVVKRAATLSVGNEIIDKDLELDLLVFPAETRVKTARSLPVPERSLSKMLPTDKRSGVGVSLS